MLLEAPPLLIPDGWGEQEKRTRAASTTSPHHGPCSGRGGVWLAEPCQREAGRLLTQPTLAALSGTSRHGQHHWHQGAGEPRTDIWQVGLCLWPTPSKAGGPLAGPPCYTTHGPPGTVPGTTLLHPAALNLTEESKASFLSICRI